MTIMSAVKPVKQRQACFSLRALDMKDKHLATPPLVRNVTWLIFIIALKIADDIATGSKKKYLSYYRKF